MPGKGKYTTYVSNDNTRNTFFKTLFAGSPFSSDWSGGGDNGVVANLLAVYASKLLQGDGDGNQKGNPDFPDPGVNMRFGASPNVEEDVKFVDPGDPAGPWVPNVVSPGPAPGVDLSAVGPSDVMINDTPNASAQPFDVATVVVTDNIANPADTSVKVVEHGVLPGDPGMGYNVNK